MAKRRLVNTKFWSDGFIVTLQPLERYLYLYLLTNEHTEICGVYELPMVVICRETDLKEETIRKALKAFGSLINYVDGWIYIKNFVKNQSSNENMKKGAQRSLEEVPPHILAKIKEIDKGFETLSKGSKAFGKPKPEPEPEPKPTGGQNQKKAIEEKSIDSSSDSLTDHSFEAGDSDSQRIVKYWASSWQKYYKKDPIISNWGKYVKQAEPFIKTIGLGEMMKLCDRYFLLFDDQLIKKNKWSLTLFLNDQIINRLQP